MKMITATEANRDFSKLLEEVSAGEVIGVTKHGRVVATINPVKVAAEEAEALKREHLALLRRRKPIAGLERGTREELYEE